MRVGRHRQLRIELADRHGYRLRHVLPLVRPASIVPPRRRRRAGGDPPWHTLVSVAQHPTTGYAERLLVPWWLWLCALGVAALAAAEVYLGAPGQPTWLPYLVL